MNFRKPTSASKHDIDRQFGQTISDCIGKIYIYIYIRKTPERSNEMP
jgi:hypothetical protein